MTIDENDIIFAIYHCDEKKTQAALHVNTEEDVKMFLNGLIYCAIFDDAFFNWLKIVVEDVSKHGEDIKRAISKAEADGRLEEIPFTKQDS